MSVSREGWFRFGFGFDPVVGGGQFRGPFFCAGRRPVARGRQW